MEKLDFAEWLGIDIPLVQAPMAGVQNSRLAIAVNDAGGLGSIPCGMLSAEQIVDEIEQFREASSNPYNLNFFCHPSLPFDEICHRRWRAELKPFFTRYGIDENTLDNRASRLPFSHEIADVIAPYAPPIISFHFGLPEPSLLDRVKGWGTKVFSSATTVEEAVWLEQHGCDAVIVQGVEAGGHRGMFLTESLDSQRPTFDLLQDVVDAVGLPVIAAGGIATRGHVEHALSLGAAAVQVGTAYLLCHEANTSALHRQALKSSAAQHTALTNVFSGRPARGIVNGAMASLGYINACAPVFPYASIEMAPLRAAAEKEGRDDFTPLWSGTNNAHCEEVSAADITRMLMGISGREQPKSG
ncbi:nitronate monooxygenase [Grimontia hollisae]|uniref:Nitronate monooxygenase n=2 Tax=Grimontia hollisae TaxID=673 RepID=D0I9Y9_GRIHO|nr:nitronate monooxygenase [Grimontia hollisae]AMG31700.1 nitronate monooxygenase [Grimontia hollisae]EEY70707.1 enoyl-[acyl-carrier-protein] reductase [FMN] [Grimontia hollisae CIP 101886]MDF2186075.1 nitronate monooxygenase [Grimontia hollisae]STO45050.1 Nitronate monooxygenase [Grimontia hollisae]STO57698.1 Nitronate monooxygenase [Grimontia hollisae]